MGENPVSARFVLTGPSGWIGRAMLDALVRACSGRLGGRVAAFGSQARTIALPGGEPLPVRPLDAITAADVAGAHVIHLAYLTKEKSDLLGEAAFAATNRAIDDVLLDAMRDGPPASLFVSSSGAAALAERGADMHPYGVAKLEQEARFLESAAALGTPAIVGRIFNLAGPHINKLRSYAISDFALQAAERGEISVEAPVPVFRSYLHIVDLCALVLGAGERGVGRAVPIDLCGAEVVEMAELAALVAQASSGSPKVRRGPVDFSRPSLYLGNPTHAKVLAMELGLDLKALPIQVADTVAWLQQNAACNEKLAELGQ
jgi:nucleoside-diphosphate-sugar epimerase